MQIPKDIVAQWSGFVTEWCAGTEPSETPSAVDRAFGGPELYHLTKLVKVESFSEIRRCGGAHHGDTQCAVRRSGSEQEPGRIGGVWVWTSSSGPSASSARTPR